MLQNKSWLVFAISGPILAAIVVIAYLVWAKNHEGLKPIVLDGQTIYVTIADTELKREQGLGGRAGLSPNEGMLFVFPTDGKYPFWMKDMRFAIDILWLSSDGTIIYVQGGVVPATYPQTFAPREGLARYVLELPAGYVMDHNVHTGDNIEI
jgi:uncharacterized membrane protein (UPF0127 family)